MAQCARDTKFRLFVDEYIKHNLWLRQEFKKRANFDFRRSISETGMATLFAIYM